MLCLLWCQMMTLEFKTSLDYITCSNPVRVTQRETLSCFINKEEVLALGLSLRVQGLFLYCLHHSWQINVGLVNGRQYFPEA